MPPRLELLSKRWSTFDLPILPFLAPRVFQPWPSRSQSLHTGAALGTGAPKRRKETRKSLKALTLAVADGRATVKEGCSQFSSTSMKTLYDFPTASCNEEAFTEDLNKSNRDKPSRNPKTVRRAKRKKRQERRRLKAQEESSVIEHTRNRNTVRRAEQRKRKKLKRMEQKPRKRKAQEESSMTKDAGPAWNKINTSERQTTSTNLTRKVDSHVEDGIQNVDVDARETKKNKSNKARSLKESTRVMKETKERKGHDENKLRRLKRLRVSTEHHSNASGSDKFRKFISHPGRCQLWVSPLLRHDLQKKNQDTEPIQTTYAENGAELNKDEDARPIATKDTAEHDFEKMYLDTWAPHPATRTSKDPDPIGVPEPVNDGLEMYESQIVREGYETPRKILRTGRQRRFYRRKLNTTFRLGARKVDRIIPRLSSAEKRWLKRFIPSMLGGDNIKPGRFNRRDMIAKLIETMSPSSLHNLWLEIPTTIKPKLWPLLMKLTLRLQPTKALGFLYATFINPQMPAPYISHVLLHAISHYRETPQQYPDHHLNELIETVFYIMAESPEGTIKLPRTTIHYLVKNLDELSVKPFYDVFLRQHQSLWEPSTLVQFSRRLARVGETDIAFELLQKLRLENFNTPRILKLCSTILQNVRLSTGAVHTEATIFKTMLELGVKPNAITHSVLMQCSIQAGDPQTAWKIFDMMNEAGIEPDACSYSILLNDAKERMDYEAIKSAMSAIRESGVKSPAIVADVLHSIFLLDQQRRADDIKNGHGGPFEPAFTQMLPVYCEHFQVDLLARFVSGHEGLCAKIAALEMEAKDKQSDAALRFHPHGAALRIMLTAYLSDMNDPQSAANFYEHVRDLIQRGDPCMEDMMDSTRLWNMILITLGRFVLLPDCAKLLGDMMSSRAGIADRSLPLEPPKPDVYTWSIMLKIFVDQHQPRAAEKVLEMMAERGIEPSIITWNTLLDGYVKLQNTEMTVDAIARLEAAGLEANEITFSTVGRLKNRKSFHRYMAAKTSRRPRTAEEMAPISTDSGKQLLSVPSTSVKSQGEQHNVWADEPAKPMDGQDDVTLEKAPRSTPAKTNDLNLRIDI